MLNFRTYRIATRLLAPFMPFWLAYRSIYGKEDPKRIRERYGLATRPRPPGTLLWLHAASVGEANSVLLLIGQLQARFPQLSLLLTTGTVTSAQLMAQRLPKNVIHQYVPVDTPQAVARFLKHWKPDIGLWVESEFWPNLVLGAAARHCFLCVLNARLSARSLTRWQKHPALIQAMLKSFTVFFAQSEDDAARLKQLGAREILCLGNLKYDAALLPCDETQLIALKKQLAERPLWLAASTHPGEEEYIIAAHMRLKARYPQLLTIIVPRHPQRGNAIAALLHASGPTARRSQEEAIQAETQFYLADTLGELGLFYRLCDIVFIGGSLVAHGGQNPLEAARLACCLLTGPHTTNFSPITHEMEQLGLLRRVDSDETLAVEVARLLNDPVQLEVMQRGAKKWVESRSGALERILDLLTPALQVEKA